MPAVPCEFFGGPLAGQVHAMPYPPQRVYRVPSCTRVPHVAENFSQSLTLLLETEEYELGPGRGDCQYSYTWVNPAASLRDHIKTLQSSLSDEREQTRQLRVEVAQLRADANRWDKLKSTLKDLGLS